MNKNPTVLFITPTLSKLTTGPDIYAHNLCEFFLDSVEINFHVATLISDKEHPQVHALYPTKSFVDRSRLSLRSLEKIARTVTKRLGKNVTHHINSPQLVSKTFIKEYRSAIQVNDYEVAFWRNSAKSMRFYGVRYSASRTWRRWRERNTLPACDTAICNSKFTQQAVIKSYALPPQKTRVIYKAVDTSRLLGIQRAQQIRAAEQPLSLLFIGTNYKRKGLDVLLDALAILESRCRGQYTLNVYSGSDLQNNGDVSRRIHANKLSRCVNLLGKLSRENIPEAMKENDIFILPSRSEALGLVIVEAICAGLPVISTNIGGIPEIIAAAKAGILLDRLDATSLANAIEHTCADPPAISKESRAQLGLKFGLTRLRREVLDVYRDLH